MQHSHRAPEELEQDQDLLALWVAVAISVVGVLLALTIKRKSASGEQAVQEAEAAVAA
jgi:hypothetical protein